MLLIFIAVNDYHADNEGSETDKLTRKNEPPMKKQRVSVRTKKSNSSKTKSKVDDKLRNKDSEKRDVIEYDGDDEKMSDDEVSTDEWWVRKRKLGLVIFVRKRRRF